MRAQLVACDHRCSLWGKGLNITDVFENTTIFIYVEREAPQCHSPDGDLFP